MRVRSSRRSEMWAHRSGPQSCLVKASSNLEGSIFHVAGLLANASHSGLVDTSCDGMRDPMCGWRAHISGSCPIVAWVESRPGGDASGLEGTPRSGLVHTRALQAIVAPQANWELI